ncbi:MAG: hypothetical protein MSIBF_02590 [Candidatus Altiarchaeales archaeon IMC4]|nr:MAG: hypothetical protein MSIBF_02590 [Candidatus Altiarchaeales archaeon IMC4]
MQNELSERLLDFAVSIIKLATQIDKTAEGYHIGLQLIRSASSAGANYKKFRKAKFVSRIKPCFIPDEEACGAESRADFIHKLQIVLKELRESIYWLRLVKKADLASDADIKLQLKEAKELSNIIGKSIITAKKQT